MTDINTDIETSEQEMGGACVIPEAVCHIVIPFPAYQHQVFDRLKQEHIERLKEKYGPNINRAELTIIGIRKFSRKDRVQQEAK